MFQIRPLQSSDLEALRLFTDREIGKGYYNSEEIEDLFRRSQKHGTMCSFVLLDPSGAIKGVRLSFPPGQWKQGKGSGLTTGQWPHSLDETAYFQSLFLATEAQGQGWGGKLSMKSIESLRHLGARGVVCHSWKESPHNSSQRYLQNLGFQLISEHPQYWENVPYNCTRCGSPPCQCTAQEMYLDLERKL